uniref:ELMO domain-containing protein 2 n=1 Tax=Ascaris suum TaxID=6253 RepID=F1L1T9_ASCSU
MDNHRDRCGRSGLCLIMCGKRDMSYHDSSSWLFIVFRFIQRHIIRVAFRWIMFLLTGKTELERVLTSEEEYPAQVTLRVERMIEDGLLPELCEDWTEDDEPELADRVVRDNTYYCEKISASMSERMEKVMSQIRGYRELCALVEARRLEKYDVENVTHEKRLLRLWDILMPEEKLTGRVTKQWQKIGFQGDDPSTDFRGMGVLSLDQLVFFAQYDVASARAALLLSNDPEYEFPMATAGITFTSMARNLLQKGVFKAHFYNTVAGAPTLDNFHRVYCQIFKLFCKFWKYRQPSSIMEFNFIKNDFEMKLIDSLAVEEANIHKVNADQLFSL